MASKGQKESFSLVRETCPAVDEAFAMAVDQMKEEIEAVIESAIDRCRERVKEVGTEVLRAALTEVCQRAIDAEDRAEEQEARADRLEREVADLKFDIRNLEKELNEERA